MRALKLKKNKSLCQLNITMYCEPGSSSLNNGEQKYIHDKNRWKCGGFTLKLKLLWCNATRPISATVIIIFLWPCGWIHKLLFFFQLQAKPLAKSFSCYSRKCKNKRLRLTSIKLEAKRVPITKPSINPSAVGSQRVYNLIYQHAQTEHIPGGKHTEILSRDANVKLSCVQWCGEISWLMWGHIMTIWGHFE